MTVNLKDIAEQIGVSTKTVSNVINGNFARVSPKTRAAIEAAIAELNYRPNVAARHLRRAHVGVLALAIPDLENPYFAEIGQAIIAAAAKENYTVLIDYTGGERQSEALVVNGFRPHLIDGVILDPQALEREDIMPQGTQVPVVLLGERIFQAPCDHIAIDNVAAAATATRHLIEEGRQRIAVLGVREESSCEAPSLRLRGYMEALQSSGRAVDSDLLLPGGEWHRAEGARAMNTLLQARVLPDAVFCFNDLLALGAMSAIHAAGYRIPEDIAVVGFDNIQEGRFAYPPLTSICPDKTAIGEMAIRALLARIKQPSSHVPQFFEVPFTLQIRQSSRKSA